jgi:hypothetical protein
MGGPCFPSVAPTPFPTSCPTWRWPLYGQVTDYVAEEMGRAERLAAEGEGRRGNRVGFAVTVLQRRLASSPEAIFQSLCRRRKRLEDMASEVKAPQRAHAILGENEPLRVQLDDPDEDLDDDIEDLDGAEVEELEGQLVDQPTSARTLAELQHEIATVRRLEALDCP